MASMNFEYLSDDDLSKLQLQPYPLMKAKISGNGGMFIEGKYFGQCKFNGKILTVDPYVPIDAFTKSLFQISLT